MSLVAQFLFQDNANDEVGNYSGTPTGITYESAPSDKNFGGKVAIFSGNSSSYITCPTTTMFKGEWTVEAWVQMTGGLATRRAIVWQGIESNNQCVFMGFMNTNKLGLNFYANDMVTDSAYTDYDWHHLAFQYRKSDKLRRILRDGTIIVKSNSGDNPNIPSGKWYIGNSMTMGGRDFIGKIANLRVYDELLPQATIVEHYEKEVLPPPPIQYWTFGQRSRMPLSITLKK